MLFWSERTTLLAVHPPLLLPLLLPFPTWERGFWAGWPLVSLPLLQEVEQHSLLLAGDGVPPFFISSSYLSTSSCSGSCSTSPGEEQSIPAASSALNLLLVSVVFCLGPEKARKFWVMGSKERWGGRQQNRTIVVQLLWLHQPFFFGSTLVAGWGSFCSFLPWAASTSPGSCPAKTSEKFWVGDTNGEARNRPHPTLLLHILTFLLSHCLHQLSCKWRAWSSSRGPLLLLWSWKARKFWVMGSKQRGGTAGKADHSGPVASVAQTFLLDLSQGNVVLWGTAVDLHPDGLAPLQLWISSVAGLVLWRVLRGVLIVGGPLMVWSLRCGWGLLLLLWNEQNFLSKSQPTSVTQENRTGEWQQQANMNTNLGRGGSLSKAVLIFSIVLEIFLLSIGSNPVLMKATLMLWGFIPFHQATLKTRKKSSLFRALPQCFLLYSSRWTFHHHLKQENGFLSRGCR